MTAFGRGAAAAAIAGLFLGALPSTHSFLPVSTGPTGNSCAVSNTQLHLFEFLNEGKKALVRTLAGDYDQAAVSRLDLH